jgi:hypothetical protein
MHRALKKNAAATDSESQRERINDLSEILAFNVKARFSARIGTYGKQKIL